MSEKLLKYANKSDIEDILLEIDDSTWFKTEKLRNGNIKIEHINNNYIYADIKYTKFSVNHIDIIDVLLRLESIGVEMCGNIIEPGKTTKIRLNPSENKNILVNYIEIICFN